MSGKKKILLITTTHTGCGHKSISDALMDWFVDMPEVEVKQVDGFEDLVGKSVTALGDSYGVVTRHAKFLWKMTWDFGTRFNSTYCSLMSTWAQKRFIEMVARERPDVVVTTHPMFNSSLLTVCEEHGLDLPFVSVQADPVTVHPLLVRPAFGADHLRHRRSGGAHAFLWRAPRAHLKVGFPTRRRFTDLAQKVEKPALRPLPPGALPLDVRRRGQRHARLLLAGADGEDQCDVDIVCGRNKQLKKRLETLLKPKYGERVRILGFVTEIETLMLESDIMIARGSPNSFFEGVVMNVPLIITGALPGQEQGNPELVERYGLGIVSKGVKGPAGGGGFPAQKRRGGAGAHTRRTATLPPL